MVGYYEPRASKDGPRRTGIDRRASKDGSDFVYAGKVGTGFDTKMLVELRAQFDKIEIPKPPFTKAIGLPRKGAHWVRPQVVVQVSFMEWTGDGKMRHPRIIAVRTDKRARDVVRES